MVPRSAISRSDRSGDDRVRQLVQHLTEEEQDAAGDRSEPEERRGPLRMSHGEVAGEGDGDAPRSCD